MSVAAHGPRSDAEQLQRLQRLLPLMACPRCGGELRHLDHQLVSVGCGARYPVRHGVPIMLPDGMTDAGDGEVEHDAISRHPYGPRSQAIIDAAAPHWVLDLGAGGKLLRHEHVVQIDIFRYPCTDIVCSADQLPFKPEVFGAVVSQAVFEHLQYPEQAALEVERVLRLGGTVKIDTAFLQPEHGYPFHFFNATESGLRHWMRHFDLQWSGVEPYQHPQWALWWFLGVYVDRLPAAEQQVVRNATVADLLRALNDAARGQLAAADLALAQALMTLPATALRQLAAGVSAEGVRRPDSSLFASPHLLASASNEGLLTSMRAERENAALRQAVADGSAQHSADLALAAITAHRTRFLASYLPGEAHDHQHQRASQLRASFGLAARALLPKGLSAQLRRWRGSRRSHARVANFAGYDIAVLHVAADPVRLIDLFFSLVEQQHSHWTLCVGLPSQGSQMLGRIAQDLADLDQRVQLVHLSAPIRPENPSHFDDLAVAAQAPWLTAFDGAVLPLPSAVGHWVTVAANTPDVQAMTCDGWGPMRLSGLRLYAQGRAAEQSGLAWDHGVVFKRDLAQPNGGRSQGQTAHIDRPLWVHRDTAPRA